MLQIGLTHPAAEHIAHQCAKWQRTDPQLFKILKDSPVLKEAVAECSCQQLVFRQVKSVVRISTLLYSGSKASQLLD